jgi:short-subunit dehydrogenase
MAKSHFTPRPLETQVIVVTGASSGIGAATAKLAASKGASVVLAARNEAALSHLCSAISSAGGKCVYVVADVARGEDLEKIRDQAISSFGRVDTWINNAGTGLFGYLLDGELRDERALFETNFWGTRMGSQIAVETMSEEGGVLINMGSEASVASQPLLGMYSASKHAIKAMTEALRSELRDRQIPIEVCLIRPTAIDTPFAEHSKNALDEGEPALPSPRYSADVAAEAIVRCATHPQRDVYVGGPARLSAILDTFLPKVKDMYTESQLKSMKKGTLHAHEEAQEILHHPALREGVVKGENGEEPARERSLYTELTTLNLIKTVSENIKETINEFRKTQH